MRQGRQANQQERSGVVEAASVFAPGGFVGVCVEVWAGDMVVLADLGGTRPIAAALRMI